MKRALLGLALALLCLSAQAEEMLTVRSLQSFPEAMSTLQAAINERGYKVARVQRVDVGLTGRGYSSDFYRVVFYGQAEELNRIAARHPQLIPFLPLSVAIFAEGDETVITSPRPGHLAQLFPDPALAQTFARWDRDLVSIMDALREADRARFRTGP